MAIVAFWLFIGFFLGSLALIWWTLYVDHDLTEEPCEEEEDKGDNPLAGVDGVSHLSHPPSNFTNVHVRRASGSLFCAECSTARSGSSYLLLY